MFFLNDGGGGGGGGDGSEELVIVATKHNVVIGTEAQIYTVSVSSTSDSLSSLCYMYIYCHISTLYFSRHWYNVAFQ